jgi:hypothetical protein
MTALTHSDAIGERFGVATADSLYQKSKGAVWYSGDISGRVPKSMMPMERGLARETSANT